MEEVKEAKPVEQKKPRPEPGVYPICRLPQNKEERALWRRLIVVLEAAYSFLYHPHSPLETMKTKRGIELLNSDDHKNIITGKLGKSLEDYRPDIVHQV